MPAAADLSRGFSRRLALSALLSRSATYILVAGLNALVFLNTRSAGWLAACLLSARLAAAVAAPPAGWLVDRLDRRRLLIASDLLTGGIALAAVLAGRPWMLVLAAALNGIADTVIRPATLALLQAATPPDLLARRSGLVLGAMNGALLAGPLLGGVGVSLWGARALAGAALLAGASVLVLLQTPRPVPELRAPAGRRGTHGAWAGLAYCRSEAWLGPVLVFTALGAAVSGLINAAEAPLGIHLGGAWAYGLISAASGLGATFGALSVRRLDERALLRLPGPVLLLGGTATCLVALPDTVWLVLPLMVCHCFGLIFAYSCRDVLLQRQAPAAILGRVVAALDLLKTLAFAAGVPLGALLISGPLGLQGSYLVFGAVMLLAAPAAWRMRRSLPPR